LEQPAVRKTKYRSPKIQNDVIEIIGKDMIQKKIVSKIKAAHFYSILTDEVTSHNKEELSLCIRFLHKGYTIQEEFFGVCETASNNRRTYSQCCWCRDDKAKSLWQAQHALQYSKHHYTGTLSAERRNPTRGSRHK